MSYFLLFFGYSVDLAWLFLAFVYAFVLCISNHFNIIHNQHLTGRRAWACLLLIAAWFYYVYADAYYCYYWVSKFDITEADIYEKAGREWLSVITSIVTTLLIAGCKFGDKTKIHG